MFVWIRRRRFRTVIIQGLVSGPHVLSHVPTHTYCNVFSPNNIAPHHIGAQQSEFNRSWTQTRASPRLNLPSCHLLFGPDGIRFSLEVPVCPAFCLRRCGWFVCPPKLYSVQCALGFALANLGHAFHGFSFDYSLSLATPVGHGRKPRK